MEHIELSVLRDFSRTPGPRFEWEGKHSVELFRKNILLPKLIEAQQAGKKLRVNLDGTAAYGTSFLEEAFGGLVRHEEVSKEDTLQLIVYVSEEEDYLIEDILEYINDAEPEL
jgi:hypothetical protein